MTGGEEERREEETQGGHEGAGHRWRCTNPDPGPQRSSEHTFLTLKF